MHPFALILLLAHLALTKAGLLFGRPHLDRHLQARDEWNPSNSTLTCLFLTSESGWGGEMQNLCQTGGVCAGQLPDGLTSNVSSAGPTDGQICFLYTNAGCTGTRSDPIVYPGYADLSKIGFDKKAISWRCWKMCGYVFESSSSSTILSTVQPTLGPASLSASTAKVPLSTSTSAAPSITSTRSFSFSPSKKRQAEATSNSRPPITTTLTGSQPAVDASSREITSTITATTSTSRTTSSIVETRSNTSGAVGTSSTTASSTASSSTVTETSSSVTVNTNTPGFSMSPSPVTLTHTFADGSTETTTTNVMEPVPTVPSGSAK